MTGLLSPTHAAAQETAEETSKPGSRDKNKDANQTKPGSRDKNDPPSISSPQLKPSSKVDPGANMLSFHKYSQITKQN